MTDINQPTHQEILKRIFLQADFLERAPKDYPISEELLAFSKMLSETEEHCNEEERMDIETLMRLSATLERHCRNVWDRHAA